MDKLGIDAGAILFYVVNFGVLAVVLKKLLYKPALKYMDERRELIGKNISESERLRTEFEQLMKQKHAEHAAVLGKLQQELMETKQNAVEQAKKQRAEIAVEKAAILAEARQEVEKMKEQVETEVAEQVMAKVRILLSHALRSNLPAEEVVMKLNQAWTVLKGRG